MEQIPIRTVATWTGGHYEGPDLPVVGVSVDSRTISKGDLFIPLSGPRFDGHAFVGEAFASGAAAALVDRPDIAALHRDMGRPVVLVPDTRAALGAMAAAYRRELDLCVIAITGSNGKTTSKEMLLQVLGPTAVASPHSYNNDVGVPLTLLRANRHHNECIVEMGTNGPGEIEELCRIARPDVGVVLNVAESHLEGLRSVEGVAKEKFALIESLPQDGFAILNYDDERTRAMMDEAPCHAISFGTWPVADLYAGEVKATFRKLRFRLLNRLEVRMSVFGVFNVHNALAAAAVGLLLKRDPAQIRDALEEFRPVPMRMQVRDVGGAKLVHDAYNANPRSTIAALHEIGYRGGDGRRIAVLGDMLELGAKAAALHSKVGREAAGARLDILWAIGPESKATAAGARAAGLKNVHWSPSVEEALRSPPFEARPNDVILFKASRGIGLERIHDAVRDGLSLAVAEAQPNAPRKRPETTGKSKESKESLST